MIKLLKKTSKVFLKAHLVYKKDYLVVYKRKFFFIHFEAYAKIILKINYVCPVKF